MPALDWDKITAITITNPINPPTYRIYLLLSDNKNPTKGKPAQRHAANRIVKTPRNPQSSRYLKETEKLNYPEHCLQKARNNNDKTIYRYPRIFLFILPVK